MPVIVNSQNQHPSLPSLGTLSTIDQEEASRQDIRPLEIAIVNLMPKKEPTEKQLATWLGHSPLQVRLTLAATDSYVKDVRAGRRACKNTPAKHILDFYNAFSEIREKKFDGLIVTGVNALKDRVEQETYWPEIVDLLEWSRTNVLSSLFLCWGAKAALKHFHDIDSIKQKEKIWGVFPHQVSSDVTGLARGLNDVFDLPVSRWKTPSLADIEAHPALEVVALSKEVGPNVLVEHEALEAGGAFPRRVYVLAHPEYERYTLREEYERDQSGVVPRHYFPNDDPSQSPSVTWRSSGWLYTNWVHLIYKATPYDRAQIPTPHRVSQETTCVTRRLIP